MEAWSTLNLAHFVLDMQVLPRNALDDVKNLKFVEHDIGDVLHLVHGHCLQILVVSLDLIHDVVNKMNGVCAVGQAC